MALATADASGSPGVRMVLLKGLDAQGLVFYTNLESPKAGALAANPRAEVCFFWPPERQVRVRGDVEAVTVQEADSYFASRPRLSQLGAWASRQSRPIGSYAELERAVAGAAVRFGIGAVPRPPHWSGFRLVPERFEFWEQRPFRLHRRREFLRRDGHWEEQALFP
jgi:pyridoxamine 5'-phosphate oxidase